ncbi:MAG: membrane protein insertase YidC [Verrucomicrobia bacterium]|nr:membrane protein insertase YidC [Verrucomicrobiota bacterium]
MDKKNTTIGVLLIIAAVVAYKLAPTAPPRSQPVAQPAPIATAPAAAGTNPTPGSTTVALPAGAPNNATFAAVVQDDGSANVVTLSNDFIRVALTDFGGAIRDVSFKKYAAIKGQAEPYVFNQVHADPILAFTQDSFPGLDRSVRYQLVSQTASEVVFRAIFENRIEVTRRYVIAASDVSSANGDPYQLRHETTFRNLTDQTIALPRASLSIGTTALLNGNDTGQYLNIGYNTGKDTEQISQADLAGGGFMGFGRRDPLPYIERSGPVVWAGAKNQFFVSIITPDQPAVSTITRRVEFAPFPGSSGQNIGLAGAIRFDIPGMAPGAESKISMSVYVGPKEYKRLSNSDVFKHDQDKVMDYTSFFFNRIFLSGYFAPLMNQLINWTAGWSHNWGFAIIITTLLIKLASLPFTLSAARSAKRMQKLQPEMAAIKVKYKDNPQKMQQANMQLFKDNKVNPLGSCLPVLIPFPFFIGIFAMLQSAPELRFAEFLWVKDLAGPDTVGHIAGFPINILPLVLGVTMIVQTRLVPQPNMDTDQAKMMAQMMKWMPLIYVVICYPFSCALALYSTVNGLFTIAQQIYINRQKDPVPAASVATATAAAGGRRGMKNVTPKKK